MIEVKRSGPSQKESLGPPQAPQATPPALAVTYPPLSGSPQNGPLRVRRRDEYASQVDLRTHSEDPEEKNQSCHSKEDQTRGGSVGHAASGEITNQKYVLVGNQGPRATLTDPSWRPRMRCNTCGVWVSIPGPGETVFHDCHLEGVTADPGRCPVCGNPWAHCECPEMPDRLAGDEALTCPYRSTGGAVRVSWSAGKGDG